MASDHLLFAGELESEFENPPPEARPWVYWFWINGNMTREGITADLTAMRRVGIGGVLIMEVDIRTPAGPAPFAGPEWRKLFKHVCAEADRLGLEVNMNNDAGWCGSGGPWIPPELSMQTVVWTETEVEGPRRFDGILPEPKRVENHYRDIAVLAFPTPAGKAEIPSLAVKANFRSSMKFPTAPANWPEVPAEETVSSKRILDLTARMENDGRLAWDVPEGAWTLLRMGHTSTGRKNHPAPGAGCGLECDKLSKAAGSAHFAGLMNKLIEDVGPLAGKTLVSTHIDSWEVGTQNWTPRFREAFERLRGYDPLRYLPVLTGRIVDGREITERFLWDQRRTVSRLLLDNYAGHFNDLAHHHRLRLSIEAYCGCPCNNLAYAGRADEPMGEFWSWWWSESGYDMAFSCTEASSAAHVYGKRIVGAEAFTAIDQERWLGHPGSIKAQGDWAFCEGINRFVFHRYAMQPWLDRKPGMSMGPWGLHYERTQTWWELSRAWHDYLARCQHLLRQGLFVADVCYLGPEGAPQSLGFQDRFLSTPGNVYVPRERGGYNFDACPPDALYSRMSVEDGRLILPDGMRYRLLVLPAVETMTPRLLRRIKELVEAGATVVGAPPVKSPSLMGFPGCDDEVKRLAAELFGPDAPGEALVERRLGKGRVFTSKAFEKRYDLTRTAKERFGKAQWIWRDEGGSASSMPPEVRYFRRVFTVEGDIDSATLVMTADNDFTCWVNGRWAGAGQDHQRTYAMDVTAWLEPGENLLTVEADNWTDHPNPAALIGRLVIEYADGRVRTLITDTKWEAAARVPENWKTDAASRASWGAVRAFGPIGTAPWGNLDAVHFDSTLFPEEAPVAAVMERLGVPPDFEYETKSGERSLRYIHRTSRDAEIYFVANKLNVREEALCSFRVTGKQPELWRPDTGRIDSPAAYVTGDGVVRVPIAFGPADSVFVVFRGEAAPSDSRIRSVRRDGETLLDTSITLTPDGPVALIDEPGTYAFDYADGDTKTIEVSTIPPPLEILGPWNLSFAPGGGAPDPILLPELISWSEHENPGVRHFSGTATYSRTFTIPEGIIARDRRQWLDLGEVEVMAEVKINGRNLGTLWKPPFRVEVTGAIRPGENRLEVTVVNLWVNRQIGDEFLPEDSDRDPAGWLKAWPDWLESDEPSPTGRFTFTTWRLWHKEDALLDSGLLGPVRILTCLKKRL